MCMSSKATNGGWLITHCRYSTDFFDTHHQVVVSIVFLVAFLTCLHTQAMQIGGSYATIPRLAERRTVRNYYQHNYPYAWCGARIAYDVDA